MMLFQSYWYCIDFANYMESDLIPSDSSFHQRKKFVHYVKKLFWDDPYLLCICADRNICRCVLEVEMMSIQEACYFSPDSGRHSNIRTANKMLQCGYY